MQSHFFPNLVFAWTFVGLLVLVAVVAAIVDARRMVIPKWITIPTAVLGLAANVVRAAWIGQQGKDLWLFGPDNGPWIGALDGLLFAVLGALCGFTLLFGMWILGTCGGGDVKLFGAVGAWVGPVRVLYVLVVSLPALLVVMILKAVLLGEGPPKGQATRKSGNIPARPLKSRISYSLPVAISLMIVQLWGFRYELELEKPPSTPAPETRADA